MWYTYIHVVYMYLCMVLVHELTLVSYMFSLWEKTACMWQLGIKHVALNLLAIPGQQLWARKQMGGGGPHKLQQGWLSGETKYDRFEKQGAKISHQTGFPSWNLCLHHAWDWVGASKFEWSHRWRIWQMMWSCSGEKLRMRWAENETEKPR